MGLHLALALNLHQRHGWRALAAAALGSNLPDWDGIPMLWDMQRYEWGHRVWGHNIGAIILSSGLLAIWQGSTDVLGRLLGGLVKRLGDAIPNTEPVAQNTGSIAPLLLILTMVQLLHLPCDAVVSGGTGLSDWPIRPWWPFSNTGYVFPLIPWGDIGPTVILMLGLIGGVKGPGPYSWWSRCTLLAVGLYLVLRGLSLGNLGG